MKKPVKIVCFLFVLTLPFNILFDYVGWLTDRKPTYLESLNDYKPFNQFYHLDTSMKLIYNGPEKRVTCFQDCLSYCVYQVDDINNSMVSWNQKSDENVPLLIDSLTMALDKTEVIDETYQFDFSEEYYWFYAAHYTKDGNEVECDISQYQKYFIYPQLFFYYSFKKNWFWILSI